MQFDEKWAFVGKKAEHCDPSDTRHGDSWDHVAFDPEHRLVVAVVPGKRSAANCHRLVAEFARRTGHRIMALMTSDDYPSYKVAILDVYGLRSRSRCGSSTSAGAARSGRSRSSAHRRR